MLITDVNNLNEMEVKINMPLVKAPKMKKVKTNFSKPRKPRSDKFGVKPVKAKRGSKFKLPFKDI